MIEAAIVLGIVGLVVGGIWVAATSVYANLRSKKATDELLAITQAVRNVYATSSNIGTSLTAPDFTTDMAQANVLPTDVMAAGVASNSTAATTLNPWSGNIAVISANNTTTFGVRFTNIPPAACVDFAMRNAGTAHDAGMIGVTGEANGTPGAALPVAAVVLTPGVGISLAQAQAQCLSNANNARNLVFRFNLKG
ncbi:MAG: type 4 pilus major pilin [Hyphomicrobium sp.]